MSRILRLGHIDLSFHAASAAVVQAILERDGHVVELSAAPHETMFERYGRAEADLLVSAWLPASHSAYLAPSINETRLLGVLYRPYCMWGVPDYVPEQAVSQVSDLLEPEVLARMDRRIQGINPGAGISRFSRSMIDAYGLAEAGYHFEPGTEAACFDGYEEAVARGDWLVVPLWHPQYLHHRYRIRALNEPKGLLGGVDEATLIIRREAESSVRARTLQTLARLHLGNDVVTMLDYRIRKDGVAPLQAAKDWLSTADIAATGG
ncbi:glycine betaine ABC transporter substrate-binding protein [Burkholderia stagnalis]